MGTPCVEPILRMNVIPENSSSGYIEGYGTAILQGHHEEQEAEEVSA